MNNNSLLIILEIGALAIIVMNLVVKLFSLPYQLAVVLITVTVLILLLLITIFKRQCLQITT